MLSDEEKKIEIFKRYINSQEQKMNDYYKIDEEFYKDEIDQLELSIKLLRHILNLIEKQAKELEESKQKEKEAYNFGYRNGCNDTSKFNDKTFIRTDKIKAKIEEVKNGTYDAKIVLQSLLEKE